MKKTLCIWHKQNTKDVNSLTIKMDAYKKKKKKGIKIDKFGEGRGKKGGRT